MLHALPPCSFACASNSKTKKKTTMFAHLSVPLLSSTPYDSGQGEGKVNTYNEPGSSRLSSYRHRILFEYSAQNMVGFP